MGSDGYLMFYKFYKLGKWFIYWTIFAENFNLKLIGLVRLLGYNQGYKDRKENIKNIFFIILLTNWILGCFLYFAFGPLIYVAKLLYTSNRNNISTFRIDFINVAIMENMFYFPLTYPWNVG